jgi:hypothetical protein
MFLNRNSATSLVSRCSAPYQAPVFGVKSVYNYGHYSLLLSLMETNLGMTDVFKKYGFAYTTKRLSLYFCKKQQ